MRAIIKTSLIAAALAVVAGCSSTQHETADAEMQSKIEQLEQDKAQANEKIAELESELNSSSVKDKLLPPNAKPGHCYARVLRPAQYKTEYVTVESKGEGEAVKVIPATYKYQTERVLVREASEKIVVVSPAKYKTVTEKILVRPAYQTWKKGRGPIEKIDAATGEIMCLVDVPAEYETVSKRVLVTPPVTKKVTIPAEYQEVRKRVVDRKAEVLTTKIPAEYKKVPKRVQVADSELVWREILCETNTTPDVVRRLQRALKAKGFNPGPIDGVVGRRTMAAVNAFQKSKGMSSGQLTMDTLKALGVTI